MRKENIFITDREFCYALAGQLYAQSPNNSPRKAETIMNKATTKFRSHCFHDNTFDCYTLTIGKKDLYYFIKNLLNSIDEFRELNLSKKEYEAGISVDDDERPKYQFVDKYSKINWENDFVDLDAFIGNLNWAILNNKDNSDDCFFCVNKGTELCKSCFVNEDFVNNYKSGRKPKGEYTFSCKYDCFYQKQICCEECKEKDSCVYKCKSCSDICNNSLYKE